MGVENLLFNPIAFYAGVFLLALVVLSVLFPVIGLFLGGFLLKLLFVFGGLVGAYFIMKNITKGRVPVITGIAQIILILALGFIMPNFLSKLGLQGIVVPMFAAIGGSFITLPFSIPSPEFWVISLIGFIIFLETQRKIGKRF